MHVRNETDSPSSFQNQIAEFAVTKVFKGETTETEKITFTPDTCVDRALVKGESYVVYRDSSGFVRECNRTNNISLLTEDLAYAKSASGKEPMFAIRGIVEPLSDKERRDTRIVISTADRQYKKKLDAEGRFEFRVRRRGEYSVDLDLPFMANVEVSSPPHWYDLTPVYRKSRTLINYKVDFLENGCSDRTIRIIKK